MGKIKLTEVYLAVEDGVLTDYYSPVKVHKVSRKTFYKLIKPEMEKLVEVKVKPEKSFNQIEET